MIDIGLIDNHSFSRGCIAKILQDLDNTIKIFTFCSSEDYLASKISCNVIIYFDHLCTGGQDTPSELPQTLSKLMHLSPTIILSTVDNANLALRAFKAGARGFVPTTETTIEMVVEIIRLVSVGGMFVPPSSLCLRQKIGEHAPPMPIAAEMFTSKELAVLDKLRLGKPNKIIAHELMMSQSTVKAHIRSIMEKMKVKNRTEIVSLWLSSASTMLLISPFEVLSPI
jgi:DNA-binding NarL/FixJ family response regulator